MALALFPRCGVAALRALGLVPCPFHGTVTVSVPTKHPSSSGSPSSSNIEITSRRFAFNSSSEAPWLCAPGMPGT